MGVNRSKVNLIMWHFIRQLYKAQVRHWTRYGILGSLVILKQLVFLLERRITSGNIKFNKSGKILVLRNLNNRCTIWESTTLYYRNVILILLISLFKSINVLKAYTTACQMFAFVYCGRKIRKKLFTLTVCVCVCVCVVTMVWYNHECFRES